MEALEGKMEQFKTSVEKFSTIKERFSYMENNIENRFRRVEEMLRRLLDMQTKTSPVVPMANPNQDLTEIPLVESKGKEIEQEEFNERSFFHHESPPGAPISGGLGFLDEGTTKEKSSGGGGRATDHYKRHFRQEEWAIGEGGDQEPPLRAPIRGRIGLSDRGTTRREFRGEGGGVADHYGRSFGKGEWMIEGGGRAEPWGSGHVRRKGRKLPDFQLSEKSTDLFISTL
ncbi:hypothetical protein M5K25_010267 [Dendrobium thyrsiflorum]|uniref:Uncharacterized protein n=1 Tax=Dendrobium thyrsiflorum TaxID=117978 RepID=A0ABD0V729_DENTH